VTGQFEHHESLDVSGRRSQNRHGRRNRTRLRRRRRFNSNNNEEEEEDDENEEENEIEFSLSESEEEEEEEHDHYFTSPFGVMSLAYAGRDGQRIVVGTNRLVLSLLI